MTKRASSARKRATVARTARKGSRSTRAAEIPALCSQGKHPPTRKIGRGCAACGRLDAWPK